jgi:hypothetical protein
LDCGEVGLEFLGSYGWVTSDARIAVSSAKVAMVVAGEVGRFAVFMRYRNGPRTLPWGIPAWMLGRAKSDEEMPVLQKRLEKEEVIDGK